MHNSLVRSRFQTSYDGLVQPRVGVLSMIPDRRPITASHGPHTIIRVTVLSEMPVASAVLFTVTAILLMVHLRAFSSTRKNLLTFSPICLVCVGHLTSLPGRVAPGDSLRYRLFLFFRPIPIISLSLKLH